MQGEGAAEDMAAAIREFNALGGIDVLIVGRGGGSLRISGRSMKRRWRGPCRVANTRCFRGGARDGFHDSDFVADLRAPTPSAAAELVVPDRAELIGTLRHWMGRAVRLLSGRLRLWKERVQAFRRSYALQKPSEAMRERRFRVDDLARRCGTFYERRILALKAGYGKIAEKLDALNPEAPCSGAGTASPAACGTDAW